MKKLSPAVRRDNLLNFPTLRLLADASFPKPYGRVIAVHHLQFPPTREPLPNIGYRGAADPAVTILGLHKELCNLKHAFLILFSSTDKRKAGKLTVCPQGKRKSTTVRPIVFEIPILSRAGCTNTNFTVLTQFCVLCCYVCLYLLFLHYICL